MKNPFKKNKKEETIEEVIVEDKVEETEERVSTGTCTNCVDGLVGAADDPRSTVCDVCNGTGNK